MRPSARARLVPLAAALAVGCISGAGAAPVPTPVEGVRATAPRDGVPAVAPAAAGRRSAAAELGRTIAVSVNDIGALGNGISHSQAISADGRFVAFESQSDNLSGVDLNGEFEIFVRDLQANRTERITTGALGLDTDFSSGQPALSGDGRFVAFMSEATNLIAGDTNERDDIFVFDREKKTMERVSLPSGVVAGQDLAGTLRELTGQGASARQADGNSQVPTLSADGRYVAFDSYASNLVPGDTNDLSDVFVRDRQTNTTERINVGPGGAQSTADSGQAVISADGRYVAYESWAGELASGEDANNAYDVYVYDRVTRTQERISVTRAGAAGDGASFAPSISADGRYVAFDSTAPDLAPGDTNGKYDVFVRDRVEGTTTRVSVDGEGGQAAADSALPSISGDGRYVGFHSFASTLVPDDGNRARDVFVHDRRTRAVSRVSVTDAGEDAAGVSGAPALSHDGRWVAFDSLAPNLAPVDTNDTDDIFVRDRLAERPAGSG